MSQDHRTLTPEAARFYATSLGDVFTPKGDAGEIASMEWLEGHLIVEVVGAHVDCWFYVHEITYNHTEYLRVKAQREREGC